MGIGGECQVGQLCALRESEVAEMRKIDPKISNSFVCDLKAAV